MLELNPPLPRVIAGGTGWEGPCGPGVANPHDANVRGSNVTERCAPIKVGLCGFTVALAQYCRWFPMVEVQQTFYDPPTEAVMRRWREKVPAEFEFTIKAWQLITHSAKSPTYRRLRRELIPGDRAQAGGFRDSRIVFDAWEATLAAAQILSATAILFQCPASFRPMDENVAAMDTFFRNIDCPPDVRLLWEPRGPWPRELILSICKAHGLVHVVDPFATTTVSGGLVYYRLHGVTGSRHVYTDEELFRLRNMLSEKRESYVLFNNIPRLSDGRRFQKVLEKPAQTTAGNPGITERSMLKAAVARNGSKTNNYTVA